MRCQLLPHERFCSPVCYTILKGIVLKEAEEVSQLDEIEEIANQKDLVSSGTPYSILSAVTRR